MLLSNHASFDCSQSEPLADGSLHPVHREAIAYWAGKRGARSMPARSDIAPWDIVKLLPYIVLFDVIHDPLDFRYRLIGTHVDHHLNASRTGQRLSQLPHQAPGSTLWATLEAVVVERQPIRGNIPYVGPHKDFKRVEDVLMPLSDDDNSVNMVLSSVVFVRADETIGAIGRP